MTTKTTGTNSQATGVSDAKLAELGEYLRGTCKSIGEGIAALGLDDEVDESLLESELLEVDIELCVQCNWWHEVWELQHNEEQGGGLCEQCCDELGIEWE